MKTLTAAAFAAAFFMLAACQTTAEPARQSVSSIPPPEIMRRGLYPCWKGLRLIAALVEADMNPTSRGVRMHKIDPNTPLIEFWKNETRFAVIAVYPQHKLVCAVLVGDALDGT